MKRQMFFRNLFLAGAVAAMAFPVAAQYAARPDAAPSVDDDASYDTAYAQPSRDADPGSYAREDRGGRTGYAHVTAIEGAGSVLSDSNGRADVQVNLPIAESDQLVTHEGGRAEVELADGNRVQIAGETRLRFDALAGEQGSEATESGLTLLEGSVAVEAGTFTDNRAFRVDTPDASVYVTSGALARINLDPRRGTSVIARRGSVDVQTRSGSIPVQAGQYVLVHGDDQPELARGTFSRDRFDVWVAQRSETLLQAHNSVSARYVGGDDYDEDVAALDNYGTWDNSSTYGNVWRPNVGAEWSPYSDGYWYNTPAGATWVDYSPWGWFPHHFGNWFFDAGFGSWCWSPAFAYSPGWVYWGFSGGYVGWCPIGYYSGFAPWGSYWGGWGSGLYFSVDGLFDFGRIDCRRGWNFVGGNTFGSRFDRRSVLSGTTMAGRLGTGARIAVTSTPLRVPLVSGRGSATTALRTLVRTAPATIASRASATQSAALTPFLARQRTLPADTVRTLRQSQVARVNPSSRTLQGPGAASFPASPRTAAPTRTFSGRTLGGGSFTNPGSATRSESWRAPGRSMAPTSPARPFSTPGSPRVSPRALPQTDMRGNDWRGRSVSPRGDAPAPSARERSIDRPPADNWRSRSVAPRSMPDASPRSGRFSDAAPDSWRSRAGVPPAQRVIEGIDRGRALPPSRNGESWRSLPQRRSIESAPSLRTAPPPSRFERQAPPPSRFDRGSEPPRYRSAPPAYERRAEPAPRFERSVPPPPRFESRPAPAPRFESRPAPAPREMHAAPPAREFRAPAPAPRSAPRSESSRRPDRSHR